MDVLTSSIVGRALAAALFAVSALPCLAHEIKIKDLQILHPHTFEPAVRLPKELPVYMVIRNTGTQSDRLITVHSDHATSATLSMRATPSDTPTSITAIELPAASETVLGPNAAFVVLRDLKESLEGYEYFSAFLEFEKAGKVEIEIYVEERN